MNTNLEIGNLVKYSEPSHYNCKMNEAMLEGLIRMSAGYRGILGLGVHEAPR